jgi:peptidyl-prolyl cis-trans isomerase A (cyclophilin A)
LANLGRRGLVRAERRPLTRQQEPARIAARIAVVVAVIIATACGNSTARQPSVPAGPAPDSFRVAFETTRGRFVVDVFRAWAPRGADRFHELVADQFFDDEGFFRVIPDFVAQFGVNDDRKRNDLWDARIIPDDSTAKQKNARGTLAFAMDGPNTRAHQLFVNLRDNSHLDSDGFAPIGRVVDGMRVLDSVYSGYRDKPSAHMISTLGNSYLRRMFPKLDYIKTARFVP